MALITDSQSQFFVRSMRYSDVELVAENEAAAYTYPWTKHNFIDCLQSGYQCWVLANKQRIIAHGAVSYTHLRAHET